MKFDFLPFQEGQVYREAPRGHKLLQCLELPVDLKTREIGGEEDKSSLVEIVNDQLEAHLGGKISRDRIREMTGCAQDACLKQGPVRCGDFLNVLQGRLRDYVFRGGDGGAGSQDLLHVGVVRSREDFVSRLKEGYWILTGCRVCGLRGDEPSSIRDMVVEIVGGGASAGESVGVEVGNCLNLRGLGRILGSGAILMSRAECYMNYRGVNEVVSRPTKLDLNNCYFLGVDSQIVRLIEIDGTPAPEPPSVAGENQLKETAGEYRNTSIWSFLTG